MMNEAVENLLVSENDDETLRLGRTPVRPRCHDRVEGEAGAGAPVPANVPGDFTVLIGAIMAGETLRGLEEEMAALGGAEVAAAGLLSWLEWVELEVQGLDELVEDLRRLRGAVMSVAASMVCRW